MLHRGALYRYRRLDVFVKPIFAQLEVLETEPEQIVDFRIEPHPRQRIRFTPELQARLRQVVGIQVRITERMHEIAGFEPGYLRHHHQQQRVRGDVERHAEENIGAALVKLARQAAVGNVNWKNA